MEAEVVVTNPPLLRVSLLLLPEVTCWYLRPSKDREVGLDLFFVVDEAVVEMAVDDLLILAAAEEDGVA